MGLMSVKKYNQKQQEAYAVRTGIVVDIQNIGKNEALLAVKEQNSLQMIYPGVWLKKRVSHLRNNSFTNMYDLFWDPKHTKIVPNIHSSNTPYSLHDYILNNETTIAVINGAFFFLADVADSKPHDLPYDFCIRNSVLTGLPSSDQPIIYIRRKKLLTKEPRARGLLLIGKRKVRWVGEQSKSLKKTTKAAILYNSKSSRIIKMRDKKTGIQIGILDNKNIMTISHPHVFDIIVGLDSDSKLRITHIETGGGTHFYAGVFVLQMKGNPRKYKVGDLVTPLTLDGLNLQNISSGITIGKSVYDPFFFESGRTESKDARSVIAEDKKGYIHFIVFDGSKYIPGFNGVSAKDITPILSLKKYNWAYFLDGGGSSRIILKHEEKLNFFANQFAFIKLKSGKHLWDWKKARRIASSISLHVF